jgi:hypothetical protein
MRPADREHRALELLVQDAHAAELDDHIRIGCAVQGLLHASAARFVDQHFGPGGVIHVAMGLPLEGIRFGKQNGVSARGESFQEAAVVGRGAVPIGGDETRSETDEPHQAASVAFVAASEGAIAL